MLDQDQREPQLAELRLRGRSCWPQRSVTQSMSSTRSGVGADRRPGRSGCRTGPGRWPSARGTRSCRGRRSAPPWRTPRRRGRSSGRSARGPSRAGLERAQRGDEPADQAVVDLVVLVAAAGAAPGRVSSASELVPVGRHRPRRRPGGPGRRRRSWAGGPGPPPAAAAVGAGAAPPLAGPSSRPVGSGGCGREDLALEDRQPMHRQQGAEGREELECVVADDLDPPDAVALGPGANRRPGCSSVRARHQRRGAGRCPSPSNAAKVSAPGTTPGDAAPTAGVAADQVALEPGQVRHSQEPATG